MTERQPYSRVYWSVRNDPRLVGIYSDDHHWATWNRLLLAADMSWPAPADLPARARPASIRALAAAGIIELLPGGLFTFHGLDTERGRRQEAARLSAAYRSATKRGADGDRSGTERLPSLAEPSRDETRVAEIPPPPTSGGRRNDETNPRARGTAPRQTGSAPRQNGHSPRQERDAEKRSPMPQSVHEILRRAAGS